MELRTLLDVVVRPTLDWLGPTYASDEAQVLLLAIAEQESLCAFRCQSPSGPARSFWQIEPPTARAVYDKWPRGREALRQLEIPRPGLEPEDWLRWNDQAACVIARGILRLEPTPLPRVGDEGGAWRYYNDRCWRPGKPRPEAWPGSYRRAIQALG